jgi:hypothetical protein
MVRGVPVICICATIDSGTEPLAMLDCEVLELLLELLVVELLLLLLLDELDEELSTEEVLLEELELSAVAAADPTPEVVEAVSRLLEVLVGR